MIFRQHELVKTGVKTQTRRIVKERHVPTYANGNIVAVHFSRKDRGGLRLKWMVGQEYAVQPKRGAKAIGKIRLTRIRFERLQDITDADAICEGVEDKQAYIKLWDEINGKPYKGMAHSRLNPLVWVLDFVYVS
jgi:hypothetical protein